MGARIRQLEPGDETELLELLRLAVREEPLAFVTSDGDSSVASADVVRQELSRAPETVVFGAFDPSMVGMLWFARESRAKLSHKALLWRAFVHRDWRGRGLGAQLLQAAIDHARRLEGLTALRLGVSDRSTAARRLYERHGFKVWGVEPDCIRFGGESAELYYMTLQLR